jgi:SAM-dependent methyltransferase
VARKLRDLDYQVTGLDGSEELLAIAREAAQDIPFLLGDARDFSLGDRRFRLAVSTFDSLNHVQSGRDLAKVFRCVYASLEPGGYFAFDLNREEAYLHLWSHVSGNADENAVSVARGSYDRRKRVALCEITLFRKQQGEWRRSAFSLTQRYHPHDIVLNGLRRAGFRQVASLDAASDLGMKGNIGQFRTFYLARKEGAEG